MGFAIAFVAVAFGALMYPSHGFDLATHYRFIHHRQVAQAQVQDVVPAQCRTQASYYDARNYQTCAAWYRDHGYPQS